MEEAIRAVLASVPGTRGSYVIRSRDGVIVVALGVDERSVMESNRRFVAWCKRHVVGFGYLADPEVWAGDVLIELSIPNTAMAHRPTGGRP